MHDLTIWLFLANALVVAMVACRDKVRSSLVPMRISSQGTQFEQHRSSNR